MYDRIFDSNGTVVFVGTRDEVVDELEPIVGLIQDHSIDVKVGVGATDELLPVTEYLERAV